MDKIKLENLKRKIKHYTPELLVAASVAAGIGALVYIVKSGNTVPTVDGDKLIIQLPNYVVDHMKESGDLLAFEVEGADFILRMIPKD